MVLIFLTILQLINLHTLLLFVLHIYRKNWMSIIKALIEKRSVDVNLVNSDGDSLLHVACQ